MKVLMIALACLCTFAAALAADSLQVTVGHVCCAGCRQALIDGAKKTAWVEKVTVAETTATITAKADQPIELVALLENLHKAGMPVNELLISTPVTMTIGHLCCGGCATALKTALVKSGVANLDTAAVTVDLKAGTATVSPETGKSVNLIPVLRQMEQGGFSATKAGYAK